MFFFASSVSLNSASPVAKQTPFLQSSTTFLFLGPMPVQALSNLEAVCFSHM